VQLERRVCVTENIANTCIPAGQICWDAAPGLSHDAANTFDVRPKTWSAPELIDIDISGFHQSAPHVAADGLTLYFSVVDEDPQRLGDIYVATRSSQSAAFANPQRIDQISTAKHETEPHLAPSGLEILFVETTPSPFAVRLRRSTRNTISELWGASTELSIGEDAANGILANGGRTLYYQTTDYRIKKTNRASPLVDSWSTAETVSVGGLRFTSFDVSDDELTILLSYQGTKSPPLDSSVVIGTRTSTASAFANFHTVPIVESGFSVAGAEMSSDGTEIYFTGRYFNTTGPTRLYVSRLE
jgi:hypothetical protein